MEPNCEEAAWHCESRLHCSPSHRGAQMRQGGDCEAPIERNPYDYSLRTGGDRVLFAGGEEPRRRTAQYRSHAPRRSDLSRVQTVVVNTVAPKKQHPGLCMGSGKGERRSVDCPTAPPLRRQRPLVPLKGSPQNADGFDIKGIDYIKAHKTLFVGLEVGRMRGQIKTIAPTKYATARQGTAIKDSRRCMVDLCRLV